MDEKTKRQAEVVDIYVSANKLRATIVLPTGSGKSKTAIDIVKIEQPEKVLILSNAIDIRDNVWKTEFEKWYSLDYYNSKVLTMTFQAAHRLSPEHNNFDDYLIILDEVDVLADTEKYENFMKSFPDCRYLGLTGFISSKKRLWFDNNLPIIYERSVKEAEESKELNKSKFVFVKYELSNERDLKIEYKYGKGKKSFYTSEQEAYRYAEDKVEQAEATLTELKMFNVTRDTDTAQEIINLTQKVKMLRIRRGRVLHKLKSSQNVVETILKSDHIGKTVIFSILTEQASKLSKHPYTGSNTKKENEILMDKFLNGKISVLSVCGKIDRGVNIPGLNRLIFESYYSSEAQFHQKSGRGKRLAIGETVVNYILLPYYRKLVNGIYELTPTVQVEYARIMLNKIDTKNNKVIDLRKNND